MTQMKMKIKPSTGLQDHVTYSVQYPIGNFVSYDNISTEYHTFLTNIEKELEPKNYQESIKSSIWCKAMNEELKALEQNETWKIVLLPNNKKQIGRAHV